MPGFFHATLILCTVLLAVALVLILAPPLSLAMAAWSWMARGRDTVVPTLADSPA